jgi:hypothetical protein
MKEETIKIIKHTEFSFAYIENAQNVAISLCRSGYLVKIRLDGTTYILEVYKFK